MPLPTKEHCENVKKLCDSFKESLEDETSIKEYYDENYGKIKQHHPILLAMDPTYPDTYEKFKQVIVNQVKDLEKFLNRYDNL